MAKSEASREAARPAERPATPWPAERELLRLDSFPRNAERLRRASSGRAASSSGPPPPEPPPLPPPPAPPPPAPAPKGKVKSKPGNRGSAKRKRRDTGEVKALVEQGKRFLKSGCTQEQAALSLSVSQGQLSKWLKEDQAGSLDAEEFRQKKVRSSAFLANRFGPKLDEVEKATAAAVQTRRKKKWRVTQATITRIAQENAAKVKLATKDIGKNKVGLRFARTWARKFCSRHRFRRRAISDRPLRNT